MKLFSGIFYRFLTRVIFERPGVRYETGFDSVGKTYIFTARIQRMGEGTVFSLFVSSHHGGGGTPVRSRWGEYPISGLGRGVPCPRSGGYPISGLGGGISHPRSK